MLSISLFGGLNVAGIAKANPLSWIMLFDSVVITIQSPQNKTYNVNTLPLNFTVETNNFEHPPVTYILNKEEPVKVETTEVGSRTETTPDEVRYIRWTVKGSTVLSNLTDGSYFLLLQRYGNPAEPLVFANVSFTVDTTSPSVQILQLENETFNSASIPLNYTVTEPSTISYSLDGQTNVTIADNTTLTGVPDGSHAIVVYATDAAGNFGASKTILFTVNTYPWIPYFIATLAVVSAGVIAYSVKQIRNKGSKST